jgi:hypothetical protein
VLRLALAAAWPGSCFRKQVFGPGRGQEQFLLAPGEASALLSPGQAAQMAQVVGMTRRLVDDHAHRGLVHGLAHAVARRAGSAHPRTVRGGLFHGQTRQGGQGIALELVQAAAPPCQTLGGSLVAEHGQGRVLFGTIPASQHLQARNQARIELATGLGMAGKRTVDAESPFEHGLESAGIRPGLGRARSKRGRLLGELLGGEA